MLSILLSIFITSFSGIFVMLSFRAWEIKKGKVPAPRAEEGSFFNFNPPVLVKEEHVRALSGHAARHGKKLAVHAVRIARENPLTRRISQTVNLVKGKNGITKKETMSAFLKSVSEHKRRIRGEE